MSIQRNTTHDSTDYKPASGGWKAVYAELGCSTSIEPYDTSTGKPSNPARRFVLTSADVYVLPWSPEGRDGDRAAYVDPLDGELETVAYDSAAIDELEKKAAVVERVGIEETPAWCADEVPDEWLGAVGNCEVCA